MSDVFFQKMEFHISKKAREKFNFKHHLLYSRGNIIFNSRRDIIDFVSEFNKAVKTGDISETQPLIGADEIAAMGIIDEISHYIFRLYLKEINLEFFKEGFVYIDEELKNNKDADIGLFGLLVNFCKEFPPQDVYEKKKTEEEWLSEVDELSGVENKYLAMEKLIMLILANQNPAFTNFKILFDDTYLSEINSYNILKEDIENWSKKNPPFGPEKTDIISMLKYPAKYSPYSLKGQLEYIKRNWKYLLKDVFVKSSEYEDLLKNEQEKEPENTKCIEISVEAFEESIKDEYLSKDISPESNIVMLVKNVPLWLNELSLKYNKSITTFDEIPESELEFFSEIGINSLKLKNIWKTSKASKRIRELCSDENTCSKSCCVYSYEIRTELGGKNSFDNFKQKTQKYGIKLAADMIPNHTSIDSKEVIENPEIFLQTKTSPIPSYDFIYEDFSDDKRVSIYIEKELYLREGCATVFKRVDNVNGEVTYIFHGNDGTGTTWNDTAQINFLNEAAREKIINKILNIAKDFSIIHFDSASCITQKQFRDIWFPEPGQNGSAPGRTNNSISDNEFYTLFPKEFWREVVERFEKEAPEVLLCAEIPMGKAVYFLGSLGIHRITNTAFMNMLKNEENEKYKQIIKSILEFNPKVLKRFVNFMININGKNTLENFGQDEKYFGICTMICTMPGLPMFDHTQITNNDDGGEAYNTAEKHRTEIFPLLKKRKLFSSTDNFCFYDFWSGGEVNNNVYVWSNFNENNKALFFFNNSQDIALGRSSNTVPFAVKTSDGSKKLKHKSFTEALNLSTASNMYTIFQEDHSKLFFIRSNEDLEEQGLFVVLNGYELQSFTNICEVEDISGFYSMICENLNGRGSVSIEQELLDLKYNHLYKALEDFADKKYFSGIENLINNDENKNEDILNNNFEKFFGEIENKAENFFKVMINAKLDDISNGKLSIEDTKKYNDEISTILNNFKLRLKSGIRTIFIVTPSDGENFSTEKHIVVETINASDISVILSYGVILFGLQDIASIINNGKKEIKTEKLIDFFGLNKKFAKNIYGISLSFKKILYLLDLFKILLDISLDEKFENDESLVELIKKWENSNDLHILLKAQDKELIKMFNKETVETIISITVTIYFLKHCVQNGKTLMDDIQKCVDIYLDLKNLITSSDIEFL